MEVLSGDRVAEDLRPVRPVVPVCDARRRIGSAGLLPRWSDADALLAPAPAAAVRGKLHLDVGRCLDRLDLQDGDMLRRRIPRVRLFAADDCRQRLRNGTDYSVRRQFDHEHEYHRAAADMRGTLLLVLVGLGMDV